MQQQNRCDRSPSKSVEPLKPPTKELIDGPNSVKKTIENITDPIDDHSNDKIKQVPREHRQMIPIIPEVTRQYNHYQIRNEVQAHEFDADKNQSQIISNSKVDDLEAQRNSKKTLKIFNGCNCQKSKCSKNYCQCFTQGRKCNSLCKCMGCQNNTENENRYRAPMQIEQGERGCNCKRSNCLKKYCECYHNDIKCTKNCKCEECKNTEDDGEEHEPDIIQPREETKRQRSEQEVEEICNKIDEIARITPQENQELVLAFLQYWLS